MSKASPFFIGILLGISAKLVDVPEITSQFPIFDDIMGRFGIWVWMAAMIAILSHRPALAAVRTFVFFVGMLSAYYGYTVLFLKFFPKSQIILWCCIALITPLCGFLIWHVQKEKWFSGILAALPFILFFTEWYLTGIGDALLCGAYVCMTLSLAAAIPSQKNRLSGLLYGLLAAVLLVFLVKSGKIIDPYDLLLNV